MVDCFSKYIIWRFLVLLSFSPLLGNKLYVFQFYTFGFFSIFYLKTFLIDFYCNKLTVRYNLLKYMCTWREGIGVGGNTSKLFEVFEYCIGQDIDSVASQNLLCPPTSPQTTGQMFTFLWNTSPWELIDGTVDLQPSRVHVASKSQFWHLVQPFLWSIMELQ